MLPRRITERQTLTMICYLAGALSPLNSDDVADDGFDDDESAGRDGETGAKGVWR